MIKFAIETKGWLVSPISETYTCYNDRIRTKTFLSGATDRFDLLHFRSENAPIGKRINHLPNSFCVNSLLV